MSNVQIIFQILYCFACLFFYLNAIFASYFRSRKSVEENISSSYLIEKSKQKHKQIILSCSNNPICNFIKLEILNRYPLLIGKENPKQQEKKYLPEQSLNLAYFEVNKKYLYSFVSSLHLLIILLIFILLLIYRSLRGMEIVCVNQTSRILQINSNIRTTSMICQWYLYI